MNPSMRVSVISRSPDDFVRSRASDPLKQHRNLDPSIHPFAAGREYTRALNAVKWDQIFAKPFLAALDGHTDGVSCLTTLPTSLSKIVSGSCDGELKCWDLATKKCMWSARSGHSGFVKAAASDLEGKWIYTCSTDQTVKVWKADLDGTDDPNSTTIPSVHGLTNTPTTTILGSNSFNALDTSKFDSSLFCTAGSNVEIWDVNRTDQPSFSFSWGCDSIHTVRFSPVETQLLLSTASDRSIVLYDTRSRTPIRKILMKMSTNSVSWNPMEGMYFVTANEDHNLYSFDMRSLDHAVAIHEDHVAAVMSVDYSPTGREIVSGSYDRTIRLYSRDAGHSRDVYHTKRMQRVFCVKWSGDNKYILSGSDDTNVRLWKARASERTGIVLPKEQAKRNYQNKLKQRFSAVDEVRRIATNRHLPKQIVSAKKMKREVRDSEKRREENMNQHKREEDVKRVAKKQKTVRQEVQ